METKRNFIFRKVTIGFTSALERSGPPPVSAGGGQLLPRALLPWVRPPEGSQEGAVQRGVT